jgi:hypothetical protein
MHGLADQASRKIALIGFFVANVSYGMWQSWWIATAFLLFIIMRIAIVSLLEPEDTRA